MKRILAATVAVFAATAWAQDMVDLGKREYATSCASCHGASGKGDGVLAKHLVKAPTDLTTLARRNTQNPGVYPALRVLETIDGRTSTDIGPHGSREMPIWGNVYRSQAMEPGAGEPNPSWYARGRLIALMEYIARIQVK